MDQMRASVPVSGSKLGSGIEQSCSQIPPTPCIHVNTGKQYNILLYYVI